ncbi:cytochrome C [Duganella sp. LX20W]|uniref:Cytochrome C n=1 Tax=Rugamonas brunnea TaxID=2758569 RepID=A0A7W2ICC9_9BURK|nr:cytochrome C [Rugamonas brunnea]MBA5638070.1 cytochrome C [Rugamonas brunnea]
MHQRALRLPLLLLPAAVLAACGGGATDTAATDAAPRALQAGAMARAADTSAAADASANISSNVGANTSANTSASAATSTNNGTTANGAITAAVLVQSPPPVVLAPVPNADGASLTFSTAGTVDTSNPFFQPFGNGRSCASCHQPGNGWTITPAGLTARFNSSAGLDPVFRPVDGAVAPNAPVATLDQKRLAYSMLLTKGLIRVGLPMPANAEFTLVKADDPYHYASAAELSLFRRPLPSTNLPFNASVMWDGRETLTDATSAICIKDVRPARCFAPLDTDLRHQANSAVRGHAEAAQDLTADQQRQIAAFEQTLFTAQSSATAAGSLSDAGALGGPQLLSQQGFYFGINDPQSGDYRTGAPFNRNVMNLYAAWRNLAPPAPPAPPPAGRGQPAPVPPAPSTQNQARAAIARGEQIFNNKPFNVVGVAGFNNELRLPLQRATCATCHNAPNVGSHSVARLFNTGTAAANLRTPDLPLYTLRNNATGEVIETSDPGSAMESGKWSDIGRFKTPGLRGLAARAPYFHNGSQRRIEDVVRFYDTRFRIGFSPQEAADLAAFLKAL